MKVSSIFTNTVSGYYIRCDFKGLRGIQYEVPFFRINMHDIEAPAPSVEGPSSTRRESEACGIYLWLAYSEVVNSPTSIKAVGGHGAHTVMAGARNSAQQACIGHSAERQATATNRDSLANVDAAIRARFARLRVTGSVQAEWNASRTALGLDSTEDGYQMEQGDSISPKPKVCLNEV